MAVEHGAGQLSAMPRKRVLQRDKVVICMALKAHWVGGFFVGSVGSQVSPVGWGDKSQALFSSLLGESIPVSGFELC